MEKMKELFEQRQIQSFLNATGKMLETGIFVLTQAGELVACSEDSRYYCVSPALVQGEKIEFCQCKKSLVSGIPSLEQSQIFYCKATGLMHAIISLGTGKNYGGSILIGQVLRADLCRKENCEEESADITMKKNTNLECAKNFQQKSMQEFVKIVAMAEIMVKQMVVFLDIINKKEENIQHLYNQEEMLTKDKRHLKYLSEHDCLTNVYNRRYYEECLSELEERVIYPISIVMADVNNLKLVNDVCGHKEGDIVLQTVASVMQRSAKEDWIVARCGGDEFTIVMPGTSYDTAEEYCKRVKRKYRQQEDCVFPPSVAMGICTYTGEFDSIHACISLAEKAMYKDKQIIKEQQNILREIMELLCRKRILSCELIEDTKDMMREFCEYLCMDAKEIKTLLIAVQYQDVGMIIVPESATYSESIRSAKDKKLYLTHTEVGYRLAKMFDETYMAAQIILQSHECWSGVGYPNHLKGEEILLGARILYMLSNYMYWKNSLPMGGGMTVEEAKILLQEKAGEMFEPELTKTFLTFLEKAG